MLPTSRRTTLRTSGSTSFLLAQSSGNLDEDMLLFAALLSIPGRERYPLADMTPQRRKERFRARRRYLPQISSELTPLQSWHPYDAKGELICSRHFLKVAGAN